MNRRARRAWGRYAKTFRIPRPENRKDIRAGALARKLWLEEEHQRRLVRHRRERAIYRERLHGLREAERWRCNVAAMTKNRTGAGWFPAPTRQGWAHYG